MKRRVAVLLMAAVFCFSSLDLSAASGQQPEKAGEETSADQEDGEEVPVSGQETGEEDSKEDLSETGTDLEEAAGQTDPAGGQEGAKPETDGTSDKNRPEGDGTGQEPDSIAGDLKPGDEEGAGPDGNEVTEETGKEGEETGQEPDGASQDTEPAGEESNPEESTEPEAGEGAEVSGPDAENEEDAGNMPLWNEGIQIARIGDLRYDTMDDAIAAAKDGDVITILANEFDWETIEVNLDEETYNIDKNITIDGGEYLAAYGERVNFESNIGDLGYKYMFSVNGVTLTLKDIEIDGCHTSTSSDEEARVCEVTNGRLVLQNCYLDNFQRGREEPIHIGPGSTMEVDADTYCGITYFHGYYPKTDKQLEEYGVGYDHNYKHGVQLDAGATLINRGGTIIEIFAEGGASIIMEGGSAERVYLEYDEETQKGGELQLKSGEVAELAVSIAEKGTSEKILYPVPETYTAGAAVPEQKILYVMPQEPKPKVESLVTGALSEEDKKFVDILTNCNLSCSRIASEALQVLRERERDALETAAAKALKDANISYSGDIYIHIRPYTQVKIKSVDAANKTIVLDISVHYDLIAATVQDAGKLENDNSISFETGGVIQPSSGINITLDLPRSLASEDLIVKHSKDNGEIYYYSTSVYEPAPDDPSETARVSFWNPHGFSEFRFLIDGREAVIEYRLSSGAKSERTYEPGDINATELLSDDRNSGTFEGWVYDGIDGVWKGMLTDDLLTKLSERYAQTGAPVRATPKYASGGSSGNHSSGSSSGGHSSGGSSSAGTPTPASAVQPISSAATGDDTDLGTPLLLLMLALAGLYECQKIRKRA